MSWRVKDVYSDRCILLTGSTGFLGKVLVEKILWAVPNVGQIFLLIRPAKGMSPKERLENVLKDPLFNRIREHKPHMFSKLVPISGDLMEDNLGLNQHDMQNICDEVSIVIHSAATVKFDEQLKDAVEMNVVGTTRLVALCHKMKNLVVSS
ncbi:NAD-binding protein [Ancylostoma duodenale]|uniref:Fatty acyl-CoA reductase n=1 Tax=Ancylostoma duodenale TaxID=51022 RepID=A0A0C2GEH4_9BILA|nr:NAD-binding protein [Ancylostoma duodenale]